PEYRRRTSELLHAEDWYPLCGELLGFLQRLEVAPSTGFIPPGPPPVSGNHRKGASKPRPKKPRGRPGTAIPEADEKTYKVWVSTGWTVKHFAEGSGKPAAEVEAACKRYRTRRSRPPKR